MSIFRLESCENAEIDSRFIESLDVTVTNIGERGFDVLIQQFRPDGLAFDTLTHVKGEYGPQTYHGLATYNRPFTLLSSLTSICSIRPALPSSPSRAATRQRS